MGTQGAHVGQLALPTLASSGVNQIRDKVKGEGREIRVVGDQVVVLMEERGALGRRRFAPSFLPLWRRILTLCTRRQLESLGMSAGLPQALSPPPPPHQLHPALPLPAASSFSMRRSQGRERHLGLFSLFDHVINQDVLSSRPEVLILDSCSECLSWSALPAEQRRESPSLGRNRPKDLQ